MNSMLRKICLGFLLFFSLSAMNGACRNRSAQPEPEAASTPEEHYAAQREIMVRSQIQARGIKDQRVLEAMQTVPRHEFIPQKHRDAAYKDHPVSIGLKQTISQPYIVAFMTEQLQLEPGQKVLEIGTGSGYQTAVLAEITDRVYTIEILCELGDRAIQTLKALAYDTVTYKCADGYQGWSEYAAFDAIIVTAAPGHVPQPLIEQLAVGGRMIIPVGGMSQELVLITKDPSGINKKSILPVRFVPMTGEAQK